jgi:hypothetical protein
VEPAVELTWSSVEVRRATGASPRQLDYWIDRGWVTPTPQRHESAGSGVPFRFSYGDALTIGTMVALVKAGIPPPVAAAMGDRYDDGVVSIRVDLAAIGRRVRAELRMEDGK